MGAEPQPNEKSLPVRLTSGVRGNCGGPKVRSPGSVVHLLARAAFRHGNSTRR